MIRFVVSILALLVLPVTAKATNCAQLSHATPFEFQFATGASWSMCWHIDHLAGLVLSNVHYGAPSELPRQLLDTASIGQILFKYNEDTEASRLLSEPGLGADQFVSAGVDDCDNGEVLVGEYNHQICRRYYDLNHLTKVRRTKPIRRHEVSLHARSSIGTHQFEQVWRFSEDGELAPSVFFSGEISRYTNDQRYGVSVDGSGRLATSAVILINWRLDFNIAGTAANDQVDEIEFLPFESDKRKISITQLDTESARRVNEETFRGWRISDKDISSGESNTTRIGYYLDPQVAGHRHTFQNLPWTEFDFFVTQKDACETFSSVKPQQRQVCVEDLTDLIDDAPLDNADIVAWFSVSRNFVPQREDYPSISAREIGFKLTPFDWSANSPFESLSERGANAGGVMP